MNPKSQNKLLSYSIATLCFLLSSFFYLVLSFIWWRNINKKLCILTFAFVCGIAAYHYIPDEDMDLNNYYKLYNSEISLVDYYKGSDGDFAKADFTIIFIFYLLSLLHLPCQAIAFSAGFVYFGCIALIAYNWLPYIVFKRNSFFLILTLIFSEYLLGFTGIRYDNSVLLLILSIQYSIQNKYRKSVAFSVFSAISHFSMIPIILIWWVSVFLSLKYVNRIAILLCVMAFFFMPIMSFLQDFLLYFGTLGIGLSSAINSYVFPTDGDVGVLYAGSRLWPLQRILSFFFLIFILMYSYINQSLRKILKDDIKIYSFLIIYLSFLFFSYNNAQLFMRLLLICNFLAILLSFFLLGKDIAYKFRLMIIAFLFCFLMLSMIATFSGMEILDLFFSSGFLKVSFIL